MSSLRSSIFLADLIVSAWPSSLSRRMMNGWNSSRAIFLGRPHWCSRSSGPTTMTRAGRVIDALAEQVLAEAALLALDHVGQRLERAVAGAEHRPLAAVVVEQRVHRLLQHPLLVADDDLGRVEIHQLLEPVVAVDDAAIEIVQVAGGEVAAVEQHERPQVRRDDRDALQHHPLGLVLRAAQARIAQRFDHLEPLDEVAQLLLGRLVLLALGFELLCAAPATDRRG